MSGRILWIAALYMFFKLANDRTTSVIISRLCNSIQCPPEMSKFSCLKEIQVNAFFALHVFVTFYLSISGWSILFFDASCK